MEFLKGKYRILCLVVICLLMSVGGIACSVDQDSSMPVKAIELIVWGNSHIKIDPESNEGTWYDVGSLTTQYPITIAMKDVTGYEVSINGHRLNRDSEMLLQLEKLSRDIGIQVEIKNTKTQETRTNYIRTLNSAIDVRTYGKGEGNGYYYFTNSSFNCKMDTSGNIVYYCNVENSSDFKPHKIDGKLYYSSLSYPGKDYDAGNMRATAYLFNDKFALENTVKYLSTDRDMPEKQALDNHELLVLGKDHYIVTAYVVKRVNNIPASLPNYSRFGSRVVAAVIQEIRDGKLLFQWDSTEHPELYGMSIDGNDFLNANSFYADYVHINSVEIDPKDNNLIISLRNISSVLKISRETGKIFWILGGKGDQFGLSEYQKMSEQHDARLTERATLTVFDNGLIPPNGAPNPFVDEYKTRVVEYKLDEVNKKLISFQEYSVPGISSPIMGSAKLLDPQTNTFLIGWGGRRAGGPLFSEINFSTNEVIFEAWTRNPAITAGSYRAYKFNE